ncbi:DnaJ sub C member 7 [Dinochytrium kinnereticum]|nr:DnaJ sub C member 7 [Dinochytrium kinnereticum]
MEWASDDEASDVFENNYTGFHPPKHEWKPDRVPPSIDPKAFFHKYVTTRTPCIFTAPLTDEEWRASKLWTPEYLKKRAGDAVVEVETRSNSKATFGSGRPRMNALFRDVVDDLVEGNTDIYLSTQYGKSAEDGRAHDSSGIREMDSDASRKMAVEPELELVERFEEFCQQPLRRLMEDFPLRPKAMGRLVPQQVNMWMGASGPLGSSSGLHHGINLNHFADNLYVLIRGRKKFTLFSPQDAENLYLYGQMKQVHSNGLVQYTGKKIRGDGAFVSDILRWKLRTAKMNLDHAIGTAKEAAARKAVEQATFELMELQAEDEDIEDEDFNLIEDDYQDEDGDENFIDEEEDDEDSDEGGDAEEFAEDLKMLVGDEESEDSGDDELGPTEPPSFSKIDPKALHSKEPPADFSLLKKATKVTFELKEGEMLYLPASWFHEVHSYPTAERKTGEPSIHLAFNYWYHPPTTKSFESPYEDLYWEERWEDIVGLLDGRRGPMATLMARRNPGSWIVRRKEDGKYLGEASRATRPNKIRSY